MLSRPAWGRFVDDLCEQPLPLGITKATYNPSADLATVLAESPGSYILKPRFGSNGFGVVRVVSYLDGNLSAESDCPDTARYLDEFPRDPDRRGRDLVAAVAAHRGRYIDRATAGLPERTLAQSILEGEIRQDRASGSIYEPRVVVQRMGAGGDRFATLGAVCKRIDTAVGGSVARDFQEEPLDASLHRFLDGRVPGSDLARELRRARDTILDATEHLRSVLVPLVEACEARVHQFGVDCRLCWDAATGRAEFPFLEFQFGIGRIDGPALESVPGYKTRQDLVSLYGPEFG
jgi:hypothetical protein